MNPQEARERAEQEAANQIEERRVAREDKVWAEGIEDALAQEGKPTVFYNIPPWLFADERSQRKAEAMAREERPWDDYSPW